MCCVKASVVFVYIVNCNYMLIYISEPHILLFRRPLQGPAPTQEEQTKNDM